MFIPELPLRVRGPGLYVLVNGVMTTSGSDFPNSGGSVRRIQGLSMRRGDTRVVILPSRTPSFSNKFAPASRLARLR